MRSLYIMEVLKQGTTKLQEPPVSATCIRKHKCHCAIVTTVLSVVCDIILMRSLSFVNPTLYKLKSRSIHTDLRYQFFHSLVHAEGGILTLILSHHSAIY
ncbi:hypothetical protein AG1IA_05924 [Rhizoctonia solani AG-1 IA]|uniref:Uncharacterized protein n=1 Tax=Thanatephorus cucumeris (strain AG1-IA) TaxID=983506 RepID=L8WPV8_THACA|nr:hypothetical protein AG1IA_05924 [Rhizoctonia solani AG-1 IA]